MTATETMVDRFRRSPIAPVFSRIADLLEASGLRPLGKSNTATLLYQWRPTSAEVSDVFAFRLGPPRVISFPKSYWQPRRQILNQHLANFAYSELPPVTGPVSDSQFSAAQVELSRRTEERVMEICRAVCAELNADSA